MFYVYEFVIPSIKILSSIIIIIIIIIIIQVNLGQTRLPDPSNVGQKIIYKRSINNL
jgi:amino acid permease